MVFGPKDLQPSNASSGTFVTPPVQLSMVGLLNVTLAVAGTPVNNTANSTGRIALRVAGVLPSVFDLGATMAAAHLQLAGDVGRQVVAALLRQSSNVLPLPFLYSHIMYVPVLRAGSSLAAAAASGNLTWFLDPAAISRSMNGFVQDPALQVSLVVQSGNSSMEVFTGSWSRSDSSYVLGVRCLRPGNNTARLLLTALPPANTSLQPLQVSQSSSNMMVCTFGWKYPGLFCGRPSVLCAAHTCEQTRDQLHALTLDLRLPCCSQPQLQCRCRPTCPSTAHLQLQLPAPPVSA
jgi:hypothetical protein